MFFLRYDKNMDIRENIIHYKNDLPYAATLCRIAATRPHYHAKELEFVFCLEGEITLIAGHQRVVVKAGEIFSVDFRDIHYLKADADNLVLLFHLNLNALDMPWEFLKNIFFACESTHCQPYQQKAMDEVKDIILTLSCILYSRTEYHFPAESLRRTANRLLAILTRYFNWFNYNNQDEYINQSNYSRYHRALTYCNENYMNKISISQLAAREHVNVNYFSQFIRKTVFERFRDMLKYIRCYEAEQLLLKTDLPIAEISYRCGFSDPKYFYAAFKLWWKCTPTEHRNNYREYLQGAVPPTIIEREEAAQLIKEHLTQWMLEKTLRG